MSLDDFVSLYDKKKEAEVVRTSARQDPYSPGVYDTVVSETRERTGQNPTINQQTGHMIELSPYATRRLLNAWYNAANSKAKRYAEQNLENILDELNKEQLGGLILATRPHKGIGYDDVADLHEEYMKRAGISRAYLEGEREAKKAAVSEIYKKIPELLEKRIRERNEELEEKDKLDRESIELWRDALTYIAYTTPSYALGIYEEERGKILEKIRDKLDTKSKLKAYIERNVAVSEEREKEAFYEVLYGLAKS